MSFLKKIFSSEKREIKNDTLINKETVKYSAYIRLLSENEGGRHHPIFNHISFKYEFIDDGMECEGILLLPEGCDMFMPGDSMELIIEVDSAVIVKEGSSFNLILDGKKVGYGDIISKLW